MYSSLVIVGINIFFFILQAFVRGVTAELLLVSSEVLFRPWTLVTSMFVHADIVHLMYNMLGLALFGTILENIIGKKRFLITYFGAGILAAMSFAVFFPAKSALGASGAVFGVLGMLAMLRPNMQVFVQFVPMPMYIAAIVWIGMDVVGLFVPTGVANLAHLTGIGVGIVGGIYLRKKFGEHRRHVTYRTIDDEELEDWERKYMR